MIGGNVKPIGPRLYGFVLNRDHNNKDSRKDAANYINGGADTRRSAFASDGDHSATIHAPSHTIQQVFIGNALVVVFGTLGNLAGQLPCLCPNVWYNTHIAIGQRSN